MSSVKPIEALFDLMQTGEISWLGLVLQSEYAQEFSEWCNESGLSQTDDTAFLFMEKKDSDSLNATSVEDLKIFLV